MAIPHLQKWGNGLVLTGWIGAAFSGIFTLVARQPGYTDSYGVFQNNPYAPLFNYFIVALLLFLLIIEAGLFLILKSKKQKISSWLLFLPFLGIFAMKKVYSLPDLSDKIQ